MTELSFQDYCYFNDDIDDVLDIKAKEHYAAFPNNPNYPGFDNIKKWRIQAFQKISYVKICQMSTRSVLFWMDLHKDNCSLKSQALIRTRIQENSTLKDLMILAEASDDAELEIPCKIS